MPTTSFQNTTIAARINNGGNTTVIRLAILAVRVMVAEPMPQLPRISPR
jgi:hypothetical protein